MRPRWLAGLLLGWLSAATMFAGNDAVVVANFDTGPTGFAYIDDAFAGTSQPGFASGSWSSSAGEAGGGLQVFLGGINGADIDDMSGGWRTTFAVIEMAAYELTLRYRLDQSVGGDDDERGQIRVLVDGQTVGTGGAVFVAEVEGVNGDSQSRTTGWRTFRADLGTLGTGDHSLTIGGYLNRKTNAQEFIEARFDNVRIVPSTAIAPIRSVQAIVDSLSQERFVDNIDALESFVTRHWDEPGNPQSLDWIEGQLESFGYTVERHSFTFQNDVHENVYATKIGRERPDAMYIISAHMDSRNTPFDDSAFAPGADDDASGTSLVLEAARAFAQPNVETINSIRFILWNIEEAGLAGSEAYVSDRRSLQGIEDPPGSGIYPEPTWLGILQHDMILFDHGLPPQPQQIAGADIDIEYQSAGGFVGDAIDLAAAAFAGNVRYATDYPAEVSADMNNTDSRSFQDDCPAISLRENRRIAEIGEGANPHWHQSSDVLSTYSPADLRFGFNVVQTTVGATAELAGARIVFCGDGIVPNDEACDDGNSDSGDGCRDCAIEVGFSCAGEPSRCDICATSSLHPDASSLPTTWSWEVTDAPGCAAGFDVARGTLSGLRASTDFSGAICVADNQTEPCWVQDTNPPRGEGFWYLTRVDAGSWGEAFAATAAQRVLDVCAD